MTEVATSVHAVLFPPSGSPRWMPCPGSVALCAGLPRTSSIYADEGTAAHYLASRALVYEKPALFFLDETVQIGERVWTFTQEMCDGVQIYLDYVAREAAAIGGTILAEQAVSAPAMQLYWHLPSGRWELLISSSERAKLSALLTLLKPLDPEFLNALTALDESTPNLPSTALEQSRLSRTCSAPLTPSSSPSASPGSTT